jgi:hypothetical protein
MPSLSQSKRDKIAEQILHHLFTIAPAAQFTSEIAKEIARDEEFTRSLLLVLQQKKLVIIISQNPQGADYKRRRRWRLSNEAYEAYRKHQPSSPKSL